MSKKLKLFLILIPLSFFVFFLYLNFNKDKRVAHAGGEYKNKIYTNSISSIEANYKFTKYFEIDLQLTRDNRLVCLHDPLIHNKTFNEISY